MRRRSTRRRRPWDDDLHAIAEVYLEQRGDFLVGLLEGELVAMGALRHTSARRAEITCASRPTCSAAASVA